jgi:CHAD domain-containing protein
MGETRIVKGETQNVRSAELGLARWMDRARKMCKKASKEPSADNIHDLRTALRRCLAIESALSECDPHPDWKKMKRAAKKLLKNLGELRDSQVLLEWLGKLEVAKDGLGEALKMSVEQEQKHLKAAALKALADFDQQKWEAWEESLAPRAALVALDSPAAQYIALERWAEGHRRHRFALHNLSRIGYHRLRVGLKNFRYIVENFLPGLHEQWGTDMKHFQNLLGDAHDLDVLWSRVIRVRPESERATLATWKTAIEEEKKQRLAQYRSSAAGKDSVWQAWRAALPQDQKLEEAVVAKFSAWASFRTPEFAPVQRIAARAVELYDVLAARGFAVGLPTPRARWIVQAAALMQDVGLSEGNKGHHKESYRLIRQQPAPIGWKQAEWQLAALVARYHRKALPQLKHKEFSALPAAMQHATIFLAGILRLANCFEQAAKPIRKLDLDVTLEGLTLRAYGYDGEEPLLSKLANAKHLLEIACRKPIVILPGAAGAAVRPVELKAKTHAA